MPDSISPEFLAEHQALTARAGLADFSARTQLELTGADRATFLHSFCTNEVRKLAVGQGCEAFITDGKGGILGYVYIFIGQESLVLDTSSGQAETLTKHLDRYIIREKVEIHDRSLLWSELLLAGPQSQEVLLKLGIAQIPQRVYGHQDATIASCAVSLRRVEIISPISFLLSFARDEHDAVKSALLQAGATWCGPAAVEAARIESGTPYYGQDIQPKNLPQELARDALAISFTKGCYLGQETVARIDALGHVNKTLSGVRFSDSSVPVGTELRSGDTIVGQVTSAAFSPRLNAGLGLAYLRRGQHTVGTKLASSAGDAEIVPLPV